MSAKVRLINGKGDWGATPPTGATDADLSHIVNDIIDSGGVLDVSGGDGLVEESGTPGMHVQVAAGTIYVENSAWTQNSFEPKVYQVVRDSATTNVSISSNPSGSTRIDLICQKIDKVTTPNDDADNVCPIVVVAGTPGSGVPATPSNHEVLAQVTVASGETSITNSEITDVRRQILFSVSGDDWKQYGTIPTSGTLDDPSFQLVFAGVDLTSIISLGMKVRYTQGTVKYGIVTKISFSTNTTMTIYGGTDYDLVSTGTTAITEFYYSTSKAPYGFPMDPAKWTETYRDTTDRTQTSPVSGTWYNPGSQSLVVPIGVWRLWYQATIQANTTSAPAVHSTLSDANNTESDVDFTDFTQASATATLDFGAFRQKIVALTTKSTRYLNAKVSGTATQLIFTNGTYGPSIIKAECVYL